jgi:hypothetical protein
MTVSAAGISCIVRVTRMLSKYPTGLRSSVVRRALEAEGFTNTQIDYARTMVVHARGVGRSGTWTLRPVRKPTPKAKLGTVKRVRQDMDMQANGKHESPARRPIPHCSCCGTRIGNRAEGEPMLCFKLKCQEAA